jgi:predicted transcriptional regulator
MLTKSFIFPLKQITQLNQIKRCNSTITSAISVFQNSCYHKIDFKINQNDKVNVALNKFTAFNIGCLAVTNDSNKVIGVCSERDYIKKVSAVGRDIETLKIKDICTIGPNIIVARKDDSLDTCMHKMLFKDIRHLLIIDDNNDECLGMISIKDLIKEISKKNNDIITRLSDFKLGKGAYFGSE